MEFLVWPPSAISAGSARALASRCRTRTGGPIGAGTRTFRPCARSLGPGAQAECERALADAGRAYLRLFDRCDVILSPTLARTSWPLGYLSPTAGRETLIRRTEEVVGYTPVHNAAGCPAMSVPLGRYNGLPVGLHFAAPPGADRVLLALAYELEAAAPWADVTPDTAWLTRPA